MSTILYTVITALIIAFVLGVLLGLFKKIFKVDTNPKIEEVRNALSGANCGGCGFAGCDAFAKAVVQDGAPNDGCVAGGATCAKAIAAIMGGDAGEVKPKVALLLCQGGRDYALNKGLYNGVQTCRGAALVANGTKKCAYGCIGLGDCVASCPFGALSMGGDGLPKVDYDKCVGCGKCVATCPKHIITLIEKDAKGSIALCSCKSENKAQIRKDCKRGCFKCGLCVKKCPEKCISLESGLPQIERDKCTSCGECVAACTDKVLVLIEGVVSVRAEL